MSSALPESEIIEWNSIELKSLLKTMISSEALLRLSKKNHSIWISLVIVDLVTISLAAILCERFFNVYFYVLTIMIIGGRQVGIGSIALHDGAHRYLSSNTSSNQRIGSVILYLMTAPIIGLDIDGYRNKAHFQHHKYLLTEKDPEYKGYERLYCRNQPDSIRHFMLVAFVSISGIGYIAAIIRQITKGSWLNRFLIVTLVCAFLFGGYIFDLIFLYWIVPIATWGMFINYVRASAEHYPINAYGTNIRIKQKFRTRDVVPSIFDKIFVTTRNINFHLSHHLFPSVPFYNMRKLHKIISQSDVYKHYAHETHGYHRYLFEFLVLRFATKKRNS